MAETESSLFLLRDRLERYRQLKGPRPRWPQEIQLAVLACYRRGEYSVGVLGKELGLAPQTIGNWIRKSQGVGSDESAVGFRELRIESRSVAYDRGLRLETPRGFVVQGLSFPQVLELVTREIL